ncbi:MAG: energy-coupled thiamine transporter ThiT [Bacillota bacterium]
MNNLLLAIAWEGIEMINVYIMLAAVLLAVVLVLVFKNKNETFNTKAIVYGAMCIALAAVLNTFTVFSMPNGGSVTICRVLPLLIYAYAFGAKRGFIVGAIYGLIDFIAKPWFVHPIQFLLDYIFAFSMVGFAGIFNKKPSMRTFAFILGTVIFGFARFGCSVISGVLYWETPLWGSITYNSVLLVDAAVSLIGVIVLQKSKSFNAVIDNTRAQA